MNKGFYGFPKNRTAPDQTVPSASYAVTASYALNGGGGGGMVFPYTGSAKISGSLSVNGNTGITGSLSIDGPIGIGVGSPSHTLDLAGTARFLMSSDGYFVLSDNDSSPASFIQTSFGNTLIANNLRYNTYDGWVHYTTNAGSMIQMEPTLGQIIFNTATSSAANYTASFIEVLRMVNGNMGIGMTTPTYKLDVSGSTRFSNDVNITGSLNVSQNINVLGTASFQHLVTIYETASVIYSSGSNQFGDASNDVQTLYGTVKIPVGSLNVTGAVNISGSTTQIGTNNLLGNTTLSGSIIISGSTTTPTTPTVKIYGDAETNGAIKFMPVSKNIDTSISASYIYVSGSTNDLYFSQNSNGYNNVTRLRWLEGNMYTGLLNGGLITTQSSTVYQVGSGSGIIVNLNATAQQSPYPTVQFLQWNNLSASIASLSASFDQSFISIDSTNNIYAQGIPYTDGDINTKIPIGIVIHQNHSTINAVQTFPSVAYGWKQRTNDFIKAFGPLKISGYTLSPSGSSTGSLVLSGGTAWVDGRNYIVDRNNPSYIVEASGITTSKIYRYYQSGSSWVYDTNNAAGYATIDPTKYSNNGVLTSVGTNDWTVQRVYYFPNSATKAFYIYYGNASYANKDAAIAGIATETFSEAPNTTANAIFIGYMILRYNADFTVAASYQFNAAGLFRGSGQGGAGGGGGTTTPGGSTTQIQYNNGGAFAGVSTLTYDGTTLKATGSFTGSFTGQLVGSSSYSTTSSFAQTASYVSNAISSSYATTASYISTLKAGSGSVASFGGSPYTSSITFASAFANDSYAVTVTGEDARTWTVQSKSSTGFTINSNSSVALSGPAYWIATPFN